jgi:hypothetical protein
LDKGHGRLEIRRCCLSAQIDWLSNGIENFPVKSVEKFPVSL